MRYLILRGLIFMTLSSFLLASESLVDLYQNRMAAEENGRTDDLWMIDMQLADYYVSQNNYETARQFLESSIIYAPEPYRTDRKIDLYRLDMINGHISRAESGLIDLYFYADRVDQRSRAALLLGILNALKGDYEHSKSYLMQSVELNGLSSEGFESRLDSLMRDAKKRKNTETAKWMSAFLPGSGQIYAKNAKGAVGAIGIAVFWGGWFVYDIIQQDYYSAALVLLWPWQRYHGGNIQNAGHSVEDYNAKIEDGINRALLDYLSKK